MADEPTPQPTIPDEVKTAPAPVPPAPVPVADPPSPAPALDGPISAIQKIHLRLVAFLVVVIISSFASLVFVPFFFVAPAESKELIGSMKDALINISLLVVGYLVGSSVGSKLKTTQPKETT